MQCIFSAVFGSCSIERFGQGPYAKLYLIIWTSRQVETEKCIASEKSECRIECKCSGVYYAKDASLRPLHDNKDGEAALQGNWSEFRHLILAGLFGCLAIALVALASRLLGEPAAVFTREPQRTLNGSYYVGSFSNLGGLIWFGAAAIMSFAARVKPLHRGALILAALVTWAMGLDDVFLLHDQVYPKLYLHETIVSALYFGAIGVIVLRYHRQLSRSTLVGIVIAVIFWGLSVVLDRFLRGFGQLPEDGSKFIGIVVWAAAWTRQAYNDITKLAR